MYLLASRGCAQRTSLVMRLITANMLESESGPARKPWYRSIHTCQESTSVNRLRHHVGDPHKPPPVSQTRGLSSRLSSLLSQARS